MIEAVSQLRNIYKGKVYKRWDSVRDFFNGGIIASRKLEDGTTNMLFITDSGKSRELYSANGRVSDIIDSNGVKRTYVYRPLSNDEIEGKMIVGVPDGAEPPLVLAARWITKDLIPKFLQLKVNPSHPEAKVLIPSQKLKDSDQYIIGTAKRVNAAMVEAEDFAGFQNPLPQKVSVISVDGVKESIVASDIDDNMWFVNQFNINGDELGSRLRVVI